jgi:hypothetical protein
MEIDVTPTTQQVQRALSLALTMLFTLEAADSRAVSDEFVAMSAVSTGVASPEVMAVIDRALNRSRS